MRVFLIGLCALLAQVASAGVRELTFPSIDGGTIDMGQWSGQPVLVVNTASQCAFTRQYEDLQALYDTYRSQGLVVLAVPSDDFRQELDSAEEVRAVAAGGRDCDDGDSDADDCGCCTRCQGATEQLTSCSRGRRVGRGARRRCCRSVLRCGCRRNTSKGYGGRSNESANHLKETFPLR